MNLFNNLRAKLKDPLYQNSIYIMFSSFFTAAVGFIFWIFAAKLYTPSFVGIGTALISAMNIIFFLSIFGFDQSIIRYFPEGDKSKIFSTASIVIAIFTLTFSSIFIMGLDYWSPELSFLKNYFIIFMIFVLANSLSYLAGMAFISLRKGGYYFIQNLIMSSRLILLFPLAIFGALGIFYSVGISYVIALIFSLIVLFKFGIKLSHFDKDFLNESFHFSTGNYIYTLFMAIPGQIIAIIVLNELGSVQTAYYYISFTLASILYVIPYAFSTSLFVEGSYGEPLKRNTLRTLFLTYSLLIPAVLIIIVFGNNLLGYIGSSYTEGYDLLVTLSLSSFLMAISNIFISIKKVQKDVKILVILSGIVTVLLVGGSYILINMFGLIGVGFAWIIGYGAASLLIGLLAKKEGWI